MKYKFDSITIIKALIIAIPTYTVAILTEKMVYVIPMLALTTILATGISREDMKKRIDEDGDDGDKFNQDGYTNDG